MNIAPPTPQLTFVHSPVHAKAFSNVFVFVRSKTHQTIHIYTIVYVAYLTVDTKTLEDDELVEVWHKTAIYENYMLHSFSNFVKQNHSTKRACST